MNSRRINDTNDETQLTHEKRRSSSQSYSNLINNNNNNNNDNDNDNEFDNNDSDHDDTNPGTFNLNKVLDRFGNNIELLELILTSKVEEDRRLTEEAKLKIKQLDYQKDKTRNEKPSNHSPLPSNRLPRLHNHRFSTENALISSSDNDSPPIIRPSFFSSNHYYTPNHHSDSSGDRQNQKTLSTLNGVATSTLPFINTLSDDNIIIKKSTNLFTAPCLSAQPPLLLSSSSPSTPIPALTYVNSQRISPFSSHKDSTTRDFSSQFNSTSNNNTAILSPPSTLPQHHPSHSSTIMNNKLPIPQIPQNHHQRQESDGYLRNSHSSSSSSSPSSSRQHQPFKRRRREMQSITMIIETKEFPYNDNYSWKNNGNTVHKKSGQRSIYYKCSNAAKGCHVNKTVTCKGHSEYLIKYRGKHLKNCLTSNSNPASSSSPSSSPLSSTISLEPPSTF